MSAQKFSFKKYLFEENRWKYKVVVRVEANLEDDDEYVKVLEALTNNDEDIEVEVLDSKWGMLAIYTTNNLGEDNGEHFIETVITPASESIDVHVVNVVKL